MVSLPLLDQVVQSLSQDPQRQRIKKLLICNCYAVWVDQPDRVEAFDWRQLLVDTLERSPTLESLNLQLNQLAKSLSKPVEYAHVANQILTILQDLYYPTLTTTQLASADTEDSTQWFFAPQATALTTQLLLSASAPPPLNPQEKALQQLENYGDARRLKKLTYCLCYHQWPQNAEQLAIVSWEELLTTLLELVPNLDHLNYFIQQVAQSISKPEEYLQLGQVLLEIIQPLYLANLGNLPAIPNAVEPILPQSNTPISNPNIRDPQIDSHQDSKPQPPQEPTGQSSAAKSYDRYNLRLELMKYTNPLMAKILMFSIVYHHLDLRKNDWSSLNQVDLDTLLELVLTQYSTAQSLKQRLLDTSQGLPQAELAQQAAAIIYRVLKPYCSGLGIPPVETPLSPSIPSVLINDETTLHTQPLFKVQD